jgi:hypothetical protein
MQTSEIRNVLFYLLTSLLGDSFTGGELKGQLIADWCKSAPDSAILKMARSYSLI